MEENLFNYINYYIDYCFIIKNLSIATINSYLSSIKYFFIYYNQVILNNKKDLNVYLKHRQKLVKYLFNKDVLFFNNNYKKMSSNDILRIIKHMYKINKIDYTKYITESINSNSEDLGNRKKFLRFFYAYVQSSILASEDEIKVENVRNKY